jgi:hypothetical protein
MRSFGVTKLVVAGDERAFLEMKSEHLTGLPYVFPTWKSEKVDTGILFGFRSPFFSQNPVQREPLRGTLASCGD